VREFLIKCQSVIGQVEVAPNIIGLHAKRIRPLLTGNYELHALGESEPNTRAIGRANLQITRAAAGDEPPQGIFARGENCAAETVACSTLAGRVTARLLFNDLALFASRCADMNH
jgi:hypothetical protein